MHGRQRKSRPTAASRAVGGHLSPRRSYHEGSIGAPPVRLGPVGPLSLTLCAVEAVPSCRFVLSGPPCLVHTRHGLSHRVGPASSWHPAGSGQPFVGPIIGARETKRSQSGASARRDLARRVIVILVVVVVVVAVIVKRQTEQSRARTLRIL